MAIIVLNEEDYWPLLLWLGRTIPFVLLDLQKKVSEHKILTIKRGRVLYCFLHLLSVFLIRTSVVPR